MIEGFPQHFSIYQCTQEFPDWHLLQAITAVLCLLAFLSD
jgi:hypothetical protein